MTLKEFWLGLSVEDRETLAARCGTTFGHLRNVVYGYRSCDASLAVNLERESGRQILCETLCPQVDWKVIRGTGTRPTRSTGS